MSWNSILDLNSFATQFWYSTSVNVSLSYCFRASLLWILSFLLKFGFWWIFLCLIYMSSCGVVSLNMRWTHIKLLCPEGCKKVLLLLFKMKSHIFVMLNMNLDVQKVLVSHGDFWNQLNLGILQIANLLL